MGILQYGKWVDCDRFLLFKVLIFVMVLPEHGTEIFSA